MRLRSGPRWVPMVGAVLALVLLAGVVSFFVTRGGSSKTVRAEFVDAAGLYLGNHVDVLGVPVGTISSVHPTNGHVVVTMSVRSSLKIAANAGAVIMAPQVVADRFVQIDPYNGGPTMDAGGIIPLERTTVPEGVDEVIGTLNNLAQQLGPNGANSNGALTSLLGNLANQLGGKGPDIHSAITNFSAVIGAAANASPQLKSLLANLGSLTQALGNNSQSYKSFAGSLAGVTSFLAADRSDIGAALANLQQFFANLTQFIDTNQGTLGASLTNLGHFAQALVVKQADLARVFDLTPLTLSNLDNAIDKTAAGGPALRARYDPVPSTVGLFNTVCGNSTLRFLVVLASGTETNPLTKGGPQDAICAVGNALSSLTPPPNAAAGPDLSLFALAQGANHSVGQS